MALLNGLRRISNAILPLRDFLYVLQLEEYETPRYISHLSVCWFHRGFEKRDHLKWTARIRVVALFSIVLMAFFIGIIAFLASSILATVAAIIIALIATPFFVLFGNLISLPIMAVAHRRLNDRARKVRDAAPNLRVIAIAGSYGKTTTKNFLYEMIKRHYKTQLIEGNINTTAGIAQWMLKRFLPTTQILIVEMDAYHPGEIAESCRIVQPTMAILTSIGDQHLVRFGSQKVIVEALQEAFAETSNNGIRVCSEAVSAMLKEYGYSHDVSIAAIGDLVYRDTTIDAAHLSSSIKEDAAYAMKIADALDIPTRFVEEAIRSFVPPDRRQQEGIVFGYVGIDDSYNISIATAHAGVIAAKNLALKSGKKLVVLTAGIPELPSEMSKKENAHYGAFLSEHADVVVVLKSEFFSSIMRGIDSAIPVHAASNMAEAVEVLHRECPVSDYVLLFQPELTDASYL